MLECAKQKQTQEEELLRTRLPPTHAEILCVRRGQTSSSDFFELLIDTTQFSRVLHTHVQRERASMCNRENAKESEIISLSFAF